MQGRLCDCVDGKIQAFPWVDWEHEFPAAAKMNLSLMEWTLDQNHLYKNPLMTLTGQERIKSLCFRHNISILSLTGDCFMQAPFWKVEGHARIRLQEDFIAICRACSVLGIRMIVVPLVDNSRIENLKQENCLVNFLLDHKSFLADEGLQVIFESDFAPVELAHLIARLPCNQFGINYDIGNSAFMGFDPEIEFEAYGERILNIHVKDRVLGGGTVPLNTGCANFELVFTLLARYGYKGNYILQTARSADGKHSEILSSYRNMTYQWLLQSKMAIRNFSSVINH
jgi:hexulose-6-phosphate isomerase